ncbi:hypothetical protein WA158_004532 [Blastocystis sp. Blastoise]
MSEDSPHFAIIPAYSGECTCSTSFFSMVEIKEAAIAIGSWLTLFLQRPIDCDLTVSLSDGVALCELYCTLFPKCGMKYTKKTLHYDGRKKQNIYIFSSYCIQLGIPACSTMDILFFENYRLDLIVFCFLRFLSTLIESQMFSVLNLTPSMISYIQRYVQFHGYSLYICQPVQETHSNITCTISNCEYNHRTNVQREDLYSHIHYSTETNGMGTNNTMNNNQKTKTQHDDNCIHILLAFSPSSPVVIQTYKSSINNTFFNF